MRKWFTTDKNKQQYSYYMSHSFQVLISIENHSSPLLPCYSPRNPLGRIWFEVLVVGFFLRNGKRISVEQESN